MNPSIEETIDRVERLYATITGQPPPFARREETRSATEATWCPRAIAWHDDGGITIAIEVPGVARENIELRIEGDRLVVRGHRAAPWGERETTPDACETALGAFARLFALPRQIEPSEVSARLDLGVLHVRITRGATAQPSAVPISV